MKNMDCLMRLLFFAPVEQVTDTAIKSIKKGGIVVIATVGNIPNFLAFEEKTVRGTLIGSRKRYGRCN